MLVAAKKKDPGGAAPPHKPLCPKGAARQPARHVGFGGGTATAMQASTSVVKVTRNVPQCMCIGAAWCVLGTQFNPGSVTEGATGTHARSNMPTAGMHARRGALQKGLRLLRHSRSRPSACAPTTRHAVQPGNKLALVAPPLPPVSCRVLSFPPTGRAYCVLNVPRAAGTRPIPCIRTQHTGAPLIAPSSCFYMLALLRALSLAVTTLTSTCSWRPASQSHDLGAKAEPSHMVVPAVARG